MLGCTLPRPAASASVYSVVYFDYYFHQLKLCNIYAKTLKQPQALSSADRNTDFESSKGVKSYNTTTQSRETLGNRVEQ